MITPDVLKERMADPITWPCGDDGINGRYRGSCRAPCCIVPPKMPDGRGLTKVEEERENEEFVHAIAAALVGSRSFPSLPPPLCKRIAIKSA